MNAYATDFGFSPVVVTPATRSSVTPSVVSQEDLQVCKKSLQFAQVSAAQGSAVEAAKGWSRAMVQREAAGSGDTENAMRRLEARYGVPWRTFWALRYRPPKSICADVWLRLRSAYQTECERQMRKLEHEIEITRAVTGPGDSAVASAAAVVDAHERAKEGVAR